MVADVCVFMCVYVRLCVFVGCARVLCISVIGACVYEILSRSVLFAGAVLCVCVSTYVLCAVCVLCVCYLATIQANACSWYGRMDSPCTNAIGWSATGISSIKEHSLPLLEECSAGGPESKLSTHSSASASTISHRTVK
jgi:hypothetical protein